MSWYCPSCNRKFGKDNQSHMCGDYDIDRLFEGKPDELTLIFDKLLVGVMEWPDIDVGATKNCVVFTSAKTYLVVRPMSKLIEVKFYFSEPLHHPLIHKVVLYGGKHNHFFRFKNEAELTPDVFEILRQSYQYSLSS